MSFGTDLSTFFSGIKQHVEEFVTNLFHATLTFFDSLVKSVAANGGQVLMDAAAAAVAAAEAKGGSASDKLAAAQAAVAATLATEGVPVVANAVNGAIEAAVASLKTSQAAAPLPVTGVPAA